MKKTAAAPGTFIHSADDKLISIAAAADKMGVTTRTIREMLADGRLSGYTCGPRVVRIWLSDIDLR